jgi:BirA family biotin operon repressor/biotin-[acetyl-CoA-carboxylase] ligase
MSTNDDARLGTVDGHVVVADAQDAGRGAHGRTWDSPAGTDLYLSILSLSLLPPSDLPLVTLACGLGVKECAQEFVSSSPSAPPIQVGVKWPNDVLVDGKKCAGILVETSSMGSQVGPLVIGIGLDVNRQRFAPELAESATSLSLLLGRELDREAVLASLLLHVEQWIDRLVAEGAAPIVAALSACLAWRGERVVCGDVSGTLRDIGARGALVVERDDGTLAHLTSGHLGRVSG